MNDASKPTLILGGTGKTGRRLAERLTAQGLPVRIGSRSGTPAFDWQDRSTWAPALDGVDAVYISYYPDLAVPGAAEAVGAFAELAVERGVTRLVLLSGRGETEAQRAEEMLKASGADWTILRCAWFSQNFSEGFLVESLLEGEVALPVGNVGEPFVDADDIAEAAFVVLTQPGHVGQLYELTGPRLL
ncbi:SDR family oxidoreductase, partial [Mesorhizobium metallidurans]|uniref:SDR family oxidoreductase n=1 Tax=Mesorhizobium metallidurans TaxID=489722 RepID=UPI00058C14AE